MFYPNKIKFVNDERVISCDVIVPDIYDTNNRLSFAAMVECEENIFTTKIREIGDGEYEVADYTELIDSDLVIEYMSLGGHFEAVVKSGGFNVEVDYNLDTLYRLYVWIDEDSVYNADITSINKKGVPLDVDKYSTEMLMEIFADITETISKRYEYMSREQIDEYIAMIESIPFDE